MLRAVLCSVLFCFASEALAQVTSVEAHGQIVVADHMSNGYSFGDSVHVIFDENDPPKGTLLFESLQTGAKKRLTIAQLSSGNRIWNRNIDDPGRNNGEGDQSKADQYRVTISGGNFNTFTINENGIEDDSPYFDVTGSGHVVVYFTLSHGG